MTRFGCAPPQPEKSTRVELEASAINGLTLSIYLCYPSSRNRTMMTPTMAILPKRRQNTSRKDIGRTAYKRPVETGKSGSHPASFLKASPYFRSEWSCVLGNSLELLQSIPEGQANLVVTSPPYALHFKKEYGNRTKTEYISGFTFRSANSPHSSGRWKFCPKYRRTTIPVPRLALCTISNC